MKQTSLLILSVLSLSIGTTAQANTQSLEGIETGSKALAAQAEIEAQKAFTRWHHAKELLGRQYQKSVVKAGESVTDLSDFLNQWTNHALKTKWKPLSKKIVTSIILESERYGFDPVFLMAVIENESSFNPEIVGSFGEIGLMQITPVTAEWITKKYHLAWEGAKSLKNPVTNIRIGSAYLAYLREKFAFRSQLYLAAYNMGSANVHKALVRQVWPKEYSSRVMHRYLRYYTKLKNEISVDSVN